MEYVSALKQGKEVVVISGDSACDSAVFWKEGKFIYTFNRCFGIMKRPDLTLERAAEHFANMLKEGSQLFIRGIEE